MEDICQDFDENAMLDAIKKSRTYEEFRVICDITNNACIITQDEYEHFKKMDGILMTTLSEMCRWAK